MRVLTATSKTQGARPGDFCFTTEGELVNLAVQCDCERYEPGGCGCRRAWAGLRSFRATTTAVVTEADITRHDLARAIAASLGEFEVEPASLDPAVGEEADHLLRIAAEWPVGTVLGRHEDVVYPVRSS